MTKFSLKLPKISKISKIPTESKISNTPKKLHLPKLKLVSKKEKESRSAEQPKTFKQSKKKQPKTTNKVPLGKSLKDTFPCMSCAHFIPNSELYSGSLLVAIQCDISMYDEHTVFPVPMRCSDYVPRNGDKS